MLRNITPCGGWTSLVSDDVAVTFAEKGHELSGSSRDLAFFMRFQLRCQRLAFINYTFVAATYFAAYAGYISIGYGVILTQVLLGTFQQVKLLLVLKRWSSHLPHLRGTFDTQFNVASLGCVPHPLALLVFRGGLPEWLCPAFDGLCAGGSWLAWQSVPERRFQAWCGLSFSRHVSQLGIPILLTVNLCFSMLLQLWEGSLCCGTSSLAGPLSTLQHSPPGSVEAAGERYQLWQELASRADVNSLVLLADGLQALAQAEVEWLCSQSEWGIADAAVCAWSASCCGIEPGVYKRKIFAKVLVGVMPSLWLTISLFAMIFEVADLARNLTCLISICVSAAAFVKMLFEVLRSSRTPLSSTGVAAVLAGGATCFFVLCVVRLAGVLACPEHHLNVWEFACGSWNHTGMNDGEWANYMHEAPEHISIGRRLA